MPTQEEISTAIGYIACGMGDHEAAYIEEHRCAELMVAAYRAEKADKDLIESSLAFLQHHRKSNEIAIEKAEARAELAERQYAELVKYSGIAFEARVFYHCLGKVLERHESERKELSSQSIDKASKPDA